jgi:hypothetical protein
LRGVAFVDDDAVGAPLGVNARGAYQEPCHLFYGFLGRRKADAHRRFAGEGVEAFEAQAQVRTAFVAGHRVHLVDDYGAHGFQHAPAAVAGEQDVEGLGRGHQYMRRLPPHGFAGRRRRVAGAHQGADTARRHAVFEKRCFDAAKRRLQIAVHVVAQGFERRYVEHAGGVRQWPLETHAHQLVDGRVKGRQGLAGSGGRGDEGVAAAADGGPGAALAGGRTAEGGLEPARDGGMKALKRHQRTCSVGWRGEGTMILEACMDRQ